MKTKKQSPILFSAPMVQAILNGTKTMTRRIVTPQPEMMPQSFPVPVNDFISQLKSQTKKGFKLLCASGPCNGMVVPECKFGEVGDLIWVREKTREASHYGIDYPFIQYADLTTNTHCKIIDEDQIIFSKWKPSIHMFKENTRIWLEITNIRIERLDSISESDAIFEGVQLLLMSSTQIITEGQLYRNYLVKTELFNEGLTALSSFKSLWKSINRENSWTENPFVWVIEFKRVDKPC